ncbi:MAG: GHKL domain-containing protein [Nitrosopumilaceae archaeon]|nr:GHKL domain-containing protein [Nitrosopumilaceae archaeon]
MKSKPKVTIIIVCQIFLILGSFITLAVFESQNALLGNSINVAGKNRFLASQFIDEVKNFNYLKNPEADPEEKLIALEENIYLLKNGGMLNEQEIPILDVQFEQDWAIVQDSFNGLKSKYLAFRDNENRSGTYQDLSNLELELDLFIITSDSLVEVLGNNVKTLSERMVVLQIIFLIVNVSVHVGLILLIINIFQSQFKKDEKVLKLAAIGELAARLSHDMRTPLSNINMGLKLIENKTSEKSEKEKIKILGKSVDRLSNQINNVMDFVRTREPTLGIWDLNSILQESLDQLKIPDSIKITLPKENLSIKCDKELFEILFLNLIKNSLESIKENGVIKFHTENNPKEIIIKIEDSGSGIPEEYLPEIFDPLVTLKNRGTGLGLASCKNIVNVHGGTITAENHPTTFTITLPKKIKSQKR